MNFIINPIKCKSIIFNPSCFPITYCTSIPAVDVIKLLGVTFKSEFNFNSHIANVVSNCSRKLFALRIVNNFLPKVENLLIYNSLIRSILEYCSPLFVGINYTNANQLNKIQNRAHKIICGSSCTCDCLQSLSYRRIVASRKLFFNIVNSEDHVLFHLCPTLSKLNVNRFIQPYSRTSRRLNSFFPLYH